MFSYYVTDKERRDKIAAYFKEKNVNYYYSEQYCLLKEHQSINGNLLELSVNRNFVYLFEWKNKKVKKENLMAL